MSGLAEAAPRIVAEPGTDDDQRLVAAVRRGDDRAFEALYGRYHRRINAYVLGMVKDHGRAEDVTQEVFVSALRRMRETERPIAFKPWIYEIAKNACIDQFRRSRRTEEVSFDAEDGLAPGDYGRLVGSDPTPDAAVAAKQELDHLCGAFGGLSDTHHEILVLRELEGLSYREIGDRMGMSRSAVESTLFRARRRLTEEYDELVSGARCKRVQGLIATAADGDLGARESRRLARHVAHCQPCRRQAMVAGVDEEILSHVPFRRRAAEKIAGLLPFPGLARLFRDGDPTASLAGGAGPAWAAQAPMLSEQASAGWAKAVAVAAVVVAGLGAGAGTHVADRNSASAADRPAAQERSDRARAPAAVPSGGDELARPASVARRERTPERRERSKGADRDRKRDAGGGDRSDGPATPPAGGPGATGGETPAAVSPATPQNTGGGNTAGGGKGAPAKAPSVDAPAAVPDAGAVVEETTEEVANTLEPVQQGVEQAIPGAPGGVGGTIEEVQDGLDEAAGDLGTTTENATEGVTGAVDGLLPPPG
jgi:RNA polymerase sigma factor (sigma-70 family)